MEKPAPNKSSLPQDTAESVPKKAKSPVPATLPEFVAARGGNARAFLRKLKKGAVLIPSREEIQDLAKALIDRPNGALRLNSLLQALDESDGSIRESILSLGEEYLRQRQAIPLLSDNNYRLVADRLLRPSVPKGSKPKPELVGIFLLLAYHRGWLPEEDVISLLARSFPAPKSKKARAGESAPDANPASIILAAPLKKPAIPLLLALHTVWQKRSASFLDRISQLQATVVSLESEKADLDAKLQEAKRNIGDLELDHRNKNARIGDLEQELNDVRTAFQHGIDETKGRLRGFLEGELSRWVQNASEAADMEPPRVRVIQERLQSMFAAINREAKWLQSSD
jgi:hypothetical protein